MCRMILGLNDTYLGSTVCNILILHSLGMVYISNCLQLVCVCVCVCVHVCVSTYCSLRTSINVCLYSFIKRMGGGRLYPPFHPSTLPPFHTHTHIFWNINQHWSTEGMSAYVFLYDKTDIICSI